ncbi:hypothetical protein ABZV77_26350 [Streptomyces sp. NPDC004732]|uniref:hypothetical protein n=1 Tax=Streptomyces sp. NPDC004732 TaxID=3154290 RepID=UPI0033B7F5F0
MTSIDPVEKVDQIVKMLLRLTRSRKLDWQTDDPWNKSTYTVSLPGYSASISSEDNDGLHPFHLTLFDSQGQPFETISSERDMDGDWDRRSYSLGELYEAVRRRVLNTDVALDNFLTELKGIDETPF